MSRPVSKSRVADLTREIRREAFAVDNLVDAVNKQRGYGESLVDALHRFPHARARLHDSLGVIDGNSASLRELLEVEDV